MKIVQNYPYGLFFIVYLARHEAGFKKSKTGIISKRPATIPMESTHFDSGVKSAKTPDAPTSPSPGPTLLKVDKTAAKVVSKSYLSIQIMAKMTQKLTTYKIK